MTQSMLRAVQLQYLSTISPCPFSPVWPNARTSRAPPGLDLSTSLSPNFTPNDHLKVDEADYEVSNQSKTSTVGFRSHFATRLPLLCPLQRVINTNCLAAHL